MSSGYRRIYYDNESGNVIAVISLDRHFIPQTIEQDITKFSVLSERNRETFNVIELTFGAFAQDFAEASGYRVNPETKELEFSYPDPNQPEEPTPYQPPLSVEVERLKQESVASMVAMVDMYEVNMRLEAENTNTMLALTEIYEIMAGGDV